MTILPTVGERFRLARDIERYPHFIAPEGGVGTVTSVGRDEVVWLQLDAPLPGLEPWNNEIMWDTRLDDFWADVEPVREAQSRVRDKDCPDLGR